MTKDFEYDGEEQELDDNKQSYTLYENSTYMVVSKVAYLIGVPKAIFENEHEPPKMEWYEELERDGFITTVVGKGSFVREADQEFVREERLKAVEGHLQAAVDAARQCGMEEQEVLEILRLLFEEM